jgi:hypothetical protein
MISIENLAYLILAFIVVMEFIYVFVYGGLISNKSKKLLSSLTKPYIRLSTCNASTIVIEERFYIHKKISLFSRYYVSDLGVVPRWSSFNKKIEEYYDIAIEEYAKK